MDKNTLNRIDRAVADNIKDIQRSFQSDAGIVLDFIVFITRQVQTDLFGFTRFTLKQFCQETGRNRQDLAMPHKAFQDGRKAPPVVQGYPLRSVIDYALYSMMERNIIFSNRYETSENGNIIHMHSFPILKDLRLNFDRKGNELKVYDVRLSDELLSGFLSRYYTVNTECYKRAGKGRGGDSRKKLLIYLSKLHHILMSSAGQEEALQTTVPMDRLCEFADIYDARPSHKKQNLTRILNHICQQAGFSFSFDYVQTWNADYGVRLHFPPLNKHKLLQEHTFYRNLLGDLHSLFTSNCRQVKPREDEHDPFQHWLSDNHRDMTVKSVLVARAHYKAFGRTITDAHARNLIVTGRLTDRSK